MGLKCQVIRNKKGDIETVNAFNEKSSSLYRTILAEHPELTVEEGLRHYAKFYTDAFFKKYGNFTEGLSTLELDDNGEPVYNQEELSTLRLSNKLESGFLTDFNITVHEFQAINDKVKKEGSVSDFIGKVIQTTDTTDITKEAVFFAYMFLGKDNGKLKSELKYSIKAWDQYEDKFEQYVSQIKDAYGFIPNKQVWFNKVRDQIIIDFLEEELTNYYNDPSAFDKVGQDAWTREEAKKFFNPSLMDKIIKWIKNFFSEMNRGTSAVKRQVRLSNASRNIVHEMINQEYRILDYKLEQDQVQVYYKETMQKDTFAESINDKARSLGLISTGSLALRAQGDIFRTPGEVLHDLDFSVPHDKMLEQKVLLDELLSYKGPDSNIFAMKGIEIVQEYDWFKSFKKAFPDFTFTNSFGNGEDILTVQGAINGEFYDKAGTHTYEYDGKTKSAKHKKGEHIAGSGYHIDLFIRVAPYKEEHQDFFKHWRDIITAKVVMGRGKDMTDHKHFVPFKQDVDGQAFITPEHSYTRDLSVVDKPLAAKVEDHTVAGSTIADPYAYEISVDKYRNEQASAYIHALAEAVNVPFEFINAVEAKHITEGTLNEWSGQPALFHKNKVYFVGANVTPELALHEFAHPLVRYIKTVNRPMFEKLFNDLIASPEGVTFLSEAISEYGKIQDPKVSDMVMEEVIVMALTKQGIAILTQTPVSKTFNNVIQKILYHIRQALRKLFGRKIAVEKLDVNTTIQQLAELLAKGDKFNVDTTLLTEEDIVAYNNDKKNFHEDMYKAYKDKKSELGLFVDDQFDAFKQQYNLVINNKNFDALRPILVNEARRGYLAEALKIKKYTTEEEVDPENKKLIEELGEIEYLHKKINAMIDNMLVMDQMTIKVKEYLESFKDDPDQQEALKEVHHYNKLIQIWKKWINYANESLSEEGVDVDTDIRSFFSKLTSRVNDIDKVIQDVHMEGVSEIVLLANPLNDVLTNNYEMEKDRLEKLIANSSGHPKENYKRRLRQEKEKYDRLYLDKDKVQLYLAGAMMEDSHMLNNWVINYIGNPDPIIGSFAKYLKNHYTDVQVNAHLKYNAFANGMDKVMKEAGFNYNATNLRKLSDLVLFDDKVGHVDAETNEYEEYLVHTFLNEHQNYKAKLVELTHKVNLAKSEYLRKRSPEAEEDLANAKAEQEHHQHLFFYSKYVDEVYKIDEMLLSNYVQEIEVEVNGEIQKKIINVGAVAKSRIDSVIEEIQDLEKEHTYKGPLSDSYEGLKDSDTRAGLWREYRMHFSERDEFGQKKPEGSLDLAIAKALKEHRSRKNEFYEWKPIQGAFETALEAVDAEIEVRLADKFEDKKSTEYKQEVKRLRDNWLADNTRIKIKDEFYELRGNILDQIKEILDQLEEKRVSAATDKGYDYSGIVRFSDVWERINDVVSAKRDNDGQPMGTEMTEDAIDFVKGEQEKMREAKKDFVKLSGLTEDEYSQLEHFFSIIRNKDPMTGQKGKLSKTDSEKFQVLINKKDDLGIDPLIKQNLISLWGALEELQSKVPTEYYMDVADNWYQDVIRPHMEDDAPSNLTVDAANDMLDPTVINEFLEKEGNEEFAEWYKTNHILIDKWVPNTTGKGGVKVPYYERVHVWNVIRPNDPDYYETTKLESGEKIDGVPTLQYSFRTVRAEHMTGYNPKTKNVEMEVGVHKDNQDSWLPRSLEDMQARYAEDPSLFVDANGESVPYDQYINKKYLKMKRENSPEFKVLEKLKEFHLEYQEGLENNEKLYHQLPRYRKENWEYILGTKGEGFLGRMNAMKNALGAEWVAKKDDFEEDGLNYQDDWAFTNGISMFAPDGKPIPLGGRFKLDHKQVSVDIMGSLMKHMYSIEMNKKLRETHPVANAFNTLINDLNPADVIHAQKSLRAKLPIVGNTTTGEPNKQHRKKAVNAMYKTWWQGQQMEKGIGKKGLMGVKTVNNLLGMASHSFFAFDITSALKNYYGAQFQIGTEAAAGQTYWNPLTKKKEKLMNYKDYALGRVWAANANKNIGLEIYKTTSKSLSTQLIDVMDAAQGRTEEKHGSSISRSFAKDAAGLTWTTSGRKYLETLATIQLFSGVMHSVKIDQTVNGTSKKIRYIDAWQLNEESGSIELKPGIDKTYGLSGDMFKLYRNRIHEISGFNQGLYAKMDSPMGNRYLAFRGAVSMRKFFTKMFLQRWSKTSVREEVIGADGKKRIKKAKVFNPFTWDRMDEKWNHAIGDFHMGYYARSAKAISRILNNPSYIRHLSPEEKKAFFRTALEPIKGYLFTQMMFLMFNLWDWDPEDPDRFKKLRKRSGAFPTVFTDEEWEENFNLMGWIQNQALLLQMSVDSENTFFLPTIKGASNHVDIFSATSVTTAATVKAYVDILDLSSKAAVGNKKGYYQQDVGAMRYQQEGEAKAWKLLWKMVGKKGKFEDPTTNIKNLQSWLE